VDGGGGVYVDGDGGANVDGDGAMPLCFLLGSLSGRRLERRLEGQD